MYERIIFHGLRPDYNENLVHNTYQFSLISAQPILSQKITKSELKIAATFKVENILTLPLFWFWSYYLPQTFTQIIWIFTEGEGDEIES